jgi:hypothetical protein
MCIILRRRIGIQGAISGRFKLKIKVGMPRLKSPQKWIPVQTFNPIRLVHLLACQKQFVKAGPYAQSASIRGTPQPIVRLNENKSSLLLKRM